MIGARVARRIGNLPSRKAFVASVDSLEKAINDPKHRHLWEGDGRDRRPIQLGDASLSNVRAMLQKRVLALVWATAGYDVAGSLFPAPLSVASLADELSILPEDKCPRVVVVWMKYGAKQA